MAGQWPRTPTERRDARRQIAGIIRSEGLDMSQAAERNRTDGWSVTAPDGTTVVYRWSKGERLPLSRMLEVLEGGE